MTVGKVEGYQGHLSRSKGRRDCEFEFENEPCYFILYRWLRFLQKLKLIDQFKTFTFWNCSRIFFQYLENGTKYSEKSLLKTPSNISQTRADNKAVLVVFKLSKLRSMRQKLECRNENSPGISHRSGYGK